MLLTQRNCTETGNGRLHGAGIRLALLAGLATLAACAGPQSAIDPAGPIADAIARTWWVLFWGATLILALVMALVFYAMFRAPERRVRLPQVPFLVGAGLVFPTVVLTALLVYGTLVGRTITAQAEAPLRIEVTGHQWWWEVHYPAQDGLPAFTTANELRLPVGRQVEFAIRSADVVHSFWIPNLGGKVDMIPGRTNVLRLEAARPGRFRGQCSEFCGAQHARMGFIAIAEEVDDFADWWRRRTRDAAGVDAAGRAVFEREGCAGCHAVEAVAHAPGEGGDRPAPTLSHLADRPTIGAGAAPLSADSLRAWLVDHGAAMKPGSLGPDARVIGEEATLDALQAYLEGLR